MTTKTCALCQQPKPIDQFKLIPVYSSKNELVGGQITRVRRLVSQAPRSYCEECIKIKWAEQNERRRMGLPPREKKPKTAYADLSDEQKAANYAAVKRWRQQHSVKSSALDRQYKKMKRFLERTPDWSVICTHYGACVGCQGPIEHIDHVNPISENDESLNCLANLQPLCGKCNAKKRGLCVDWRPDKGAFIVTTFPHHSRPFSLTWK